MVRGEAGELFWYSLAGCRLRSQRPLLYLTDGISQPSTPEVDIVFERIGEPDTPAEFVYGPYRISSSQLCDIVLPDGLHIEVRDGQRMTVDAPEGYSDSELHTVLFGPAFAVLCHQRGCPPLHASAAVFGNTALAVAGDSGAGKSTTIRALMRRGGHLLADDQLVVSPVTASAAPGFPSMKLWGNTANWFGDALGHAVRVRAELNKFHIRADGAFHNAEAPLKVIFVLVPDTGCSAPNAQKLPQPEAIALLDRLVYRSEIATHLGSRATIFGWATRLSSQIPVYCVHRSNDIAQLEELIDLLLDIGVSHGLNGGTKP
jgi:hypothetical protein